jgi:anti-sigma-K factor RskA
VRQLPPETSVVPLRRRSIAQRLTAVAAAVFFVAAAGLGVVVVQKDNQLDEVSAQAARLEQILSAPDAAVVTLKGDNGEGGTMNVAVSRSQGRMMLLSNDLASPPDGKTYQLWAIDEGGPHSMGLLEPANGEVSLAVSGDLSRATTVAVTVEPDKGSEKPTLPAAMSAELPTT